MNFSTQADLEESRILIFRLVDLLLSVGLADKIVSKFVDSMTLSFNRH